MMGKRELLRLVLYSETSPEVDEGAGATSTVLGTSGDNQTGASHIIHKFSSTG